MEGREVKGETVGEEEDGGEEKGGEGHNTKSYVLTTILKNLFGKILILLPSALSHGSFVD